MDQCLLSPLSKSAFFDLPFTLKLVFHPDFLVVISRLVMKLGNAPIK